MVAQEGVISMTKSGIKSTAVSHVPSINSLWHPAPNVLKSIKNCCEYITIAARPQLKVLCHNLHIDLIKLITDIAYNLLYNRSLPLEAAQRVSLRKHKHDIRQLATETRCSRPKTQSCLPPKRSPHSAYISEASA